MKIPAPKNISHKASLAILSPDELTAEANLEAVLIADIDGVALQAPNMNIDEAILERNIFVEANLEKVHLSDAHIQNTDLSAARCSEGSFIRVACTNARMPGIDLNRAVIKDATFTDCKFDIANFRFATLRRVAFVNCSFTDTDFQAAKFHDVTFSDCILEKTIFDNCVIKNADLRTSQLLDIRGWQSLQGAMVDAAQVVSIAPQLAHALGLQIAD